MKQIILAFVVLSIVLFACEKQSTEKPGTKDSLEYTFEVGDQINVSHYIIQASTDAKDFRNAGIIFADDNLNKYFIVVDVSPELSKSNKVFSRILATDKDGSIGYSKVTQTVKL